MSVFEQKVQFKRKMKDLDTHLEKFKSLALWINQNYERKAMRMTEFLKSQELLDDCWDGFNDDEKKKWMLINPVQIHQRRT